VRFPRNELSEKANTHSRRLSLTETSRAPTDNNSPFDSRSLAGR
jgi:hypothetical protein